MKISTQLRDFYHARSLDFQRMVAAIGDEENADYEGPLLMHCWDDAYNSSDVKILFVGQETNGWNGFDRPKDKDSIDRILHHYETFRLGEKYNSTFWQSINYINENVNSGKRLNFLWTNILKLGRSGIGRPSDHVSRSELKYLNILGDEIAIVKPDAVVFLSGPNYDPDLKDRIPDIVFENFEELPTRAFAKLKSSCLPLLSFRTYHPNYLRQAKKEAFLDYIINELRHS